MSKSRCDECEADCDGLCKCDSHLKDFCLQCFQPLSDDDKFVGSEICLECEFKRQD
jgi:hypothetical protein